MISDATKLGLLAASFLACLSTLFTSGSFHTGERGVPSLSPPTKRLCGEALHEAEECGSGSGDDGGGSGDEESAAAAASSVPCEALLSNARRCERTVERAYRHINLGGCAREIQKLTVCNLEWCEDTARTEKAREDCRKECGPVRDELRRCEDGHVDKFFRRAGLNSDGTKREK